MSWYDRARRAVSGVVPPALEVAADWLLLAPGLATLVSRALVSHVSGSTKAKTFMSGHYTVSGLDLIAEALLGSVGLVDDSVVLLEALNQLINETDPAVLIELWPGA